MNKNFSLDIASENLKDNFNTHNNYIKSRNSDNNKTINEDIYKVGTQKNRELLEKLNEISSKGGISSGNYARHRIIESSKSKVEGALPHINSIELASDGESNDKAYQQYYSGENKGKSIASKIREESQKGTDNRKNI